MLPVFSLVFSMAFAPERVFQGPKENREPTKARRWISNHQGQALASNGLASHVSWCFCATSVGLLLLGARERLQNHMQNQVFGIKSHEAA